MRRRIRLLQAQQAARARLAPRHMADAGIAFGHMKPDPLARAMVQQRGRFGALASLSSASRSGVIPLPAKFRERRAHPDPLEARDRRCWDHRSSPAPVPRDRPAAPAASPEAADDRALRPFQSPSTGMPARLQGLIVRCSRISTVSAWSSRVWAVSSTPAPAARHHSGHQAVARIPRLCLHPACGLGPIPSQNVMIEAQRRGTLCHRAALPRRTSGLQAVIDGQNGKPGVAISWPVAQPATRCISAVESDPPDTASATWRCLRRGERSKPDSGGAAGTLGFGLGPLAGVDRLGIFRADGGIGRAGLLWLAQPVQRNAELQEAVGRAAALGIFLVALQEVLRGPLVVTLGIIGFAEPVLRAAREAVLGIFLQEIREARLGIAELAAQQAFVGLLVERLRATRATAPRSRSNSDVPGNRPASGWVARLPCWTKSSSPGSC